MFVKKVRNLKTSASNLIKRFYCIYFPWLEVGVLGVLIQDENLVVESAASNLPFGRDQAQVNKKGRATNRSH